MKGAHPFRVLYITRVLWLGERLQVKGKCWLVNCASQHQQNKLSVGTFHWIQNIRITSASAQLNSLGMKMKQRPLCSLQPSGQEGAGAGAGAAWTLSSLMMTVELSNSYTQRIISNVNILCHLTAKKGVVVESESCRSSWQGPLLFSLHINLLTLAPATSVCL